MTPDASGKFKGISVPSIPWHDQRDRWPQGLVRHLRLDPDAPLDEAFAVRLDHNGGMSAGGSTEIFYTLVVHPRHKARVEELRQWLEANPEIGGVFSPPRDLGLATNQPRTEK